MYAAEHARAHPDKPAIVMAASGDVVTFGQYEACANQVARMLRGAGLQRGDHVAIFMDNDPRMLPCEGGAERTGVYYTCVNSYLSAEEVAYIVNDSEARIVITTGATAEVASRLPALCPNVERWLMAGAGDGPGGPFESWEHFKCPRRRAGTEAARRGDPPRRSGTRPARPGPRRTPRDLRTGARSDGCTST